MSGIEVDVPHRLNTSMGNIGILFIIA